MTHSFVPSGYNIYTCNNATLYHSTSTDCTEGSSDGISGCNLNLRFILMHSNKYITGSIITTTHSTPKKTYNYHNDYGDIF